MVEESPAPLISPQIGVEVVFGRARRATGRLSDLELVPFNSLNLQEISKSLTSLKMRTLAHLGLFQ